MPIKPPKRSVNKRRPLVVASAAGADGENVTRGIPLRLRASPHTEENDAANLSHTATAARHPF